LILAAFLAGGVSLLAAERATFVMDNGERISGLISTRSGAGGNLTRGNFVVDVNNRQLQLPADNVAFIDFTGGAPSSRELASLPSDGSQLMVLRDGSMQRGRLMNMLRGDTVRWQYEPGDTEDMPIRRIQRIYMNPPLSRQVLGTGNQYGNRNGNQYGRTYGSNGNAYGNGSYANGSYANGANANGAYNNGSYGNSYGSSYGTAGTPIYNGSQAGNVLGPQNEIAVPGNADWVDTGINVRAGDMVSFSASGQIQFGTGAGQVASVDGNPEVRRTTYPVPAMSVGGLIGKVGRSAAFPIGANSNAIRMPATGRLMLGVNDDQKNDNSGEFRVVIRR